MILVFHTWDRMRVLPHYHRLGLQFDGHKLHTQVHTIRPSGSNFVPTPVAFHTIHGIFCHTFLKEVIV